VLLLAVEGATGCWTATTGVLFAVLSAVPVPHTELLKLPLELTFSVSASTPPLAAPPACGGAVKTTHMRLSVVLATVGVNE
jgi:hypothetical protein